ncbi:MAG TPA: DUF1684 domain-containing protein [Steroidobacteraceae bacterium]|jgi:hypothetical protein
MTRIAALMGLAVSFCGLAAASGANAERTRIEEWRAQRLADLTGPQGWLNLVGLFWLDSGENTFGRAASNRIHLDHPALAELAGSFYVDSSGHTRFLARAASGITHDGQRVAAIDMVPDGRGLPTVLESGPLRFLLIARAGKVGVRIRDLDSPRLRQFVPIEYFPIDAGWAIQARFEAYEPPHHLRILNILGLEEDKVSPGALVFRRDGHEWRLETILQSPQDTTLFVMFTDGTTGKETYGGGRYLFVPLPKPAGPGPGSVLLDFNEAVNPPCAFNDFAVCPLPPYQNRLTLRIESGEKAHGNGASDRHP